MDIEIAYYRKHPIVVAALEACVGYDRRDSSLPAGLVDFLANNPVLKNAGSLLQEFNLFRAIGVSEKEVRHSRLLAWMLDPQGSHGEGAKFLSTFLALVCAEDGDTIEEHGLMFDQVKVRCEADHIDILLVDSTAKFVCAIENKIAMDQGAGQLERYRLFVEREYVGYEQKFVFLTLKGEKPADPAWIPIDYTKALVQILKQPSIRNIAMRSCARSILFCHYVELIQQRGNVSKSNLWEILHLAKHELKHSEFLAWLLNPNGSHGCGDRFARYLVGILRSRGAEIPESAIDQIFRWKPKADGGREEPVLTVRLCGESVAIRYGEQHMLRLQVLLKGMDAATEFGIGHMG